MEGKAHDALHDWLMPFLQLNKDYAAALDAAAKSARFKEIQDSLAADFSIEYFAPNESADRSTI